jgi:hypothetical protein
VRTKTGIQDFGTFDLLCPVVRCLKGAFDFERSTNCSSCWEVEELLGGENQSGRVWLDPRGGSAQSRAIYRPGTGRWHLLFGRDCGDAVSSCVAQNLWRNVLLLFGVPMF